MRYSVDFDGTINKNDSEYPYCYSPNLELIEFLKNEQHKGAKLILNTLREGKVLDIALAFCTYHGLIFDKINDNLDEDIEKWGYNPRKISADVYIDDKNVNIEDFVAKKKEVK